MLDILKAFGLMILFFSITVICHMVFEAPRRRKDGVIEGVWDGGTGSGYYWENMEWYPESWMEIPE